MQTLSGVNWKRKCHRGQPHSERHAFEMHTTGAEFVERPRIPVESVSKGTLCMGSAFLICVVHRKTAKADDTLVHHSESNATAKNVVGTGKELASLHTPMVGLGTFDCDCKQGDP